MRRVTDRLLVPITLSMDKCHLWLRERQLGTIFTIRFELRQQRGGTHRASRPEGMTAGRAKLGAGIGFR